MSRFRTYRIPNGPRRPDLESAPVFAWRTAGVGHVDHTANCIKARPQRFQKRGIRLRGCRTAGCVDHDEHQTAGIKARLERANEEERAIRESAACHEEHRES